METPLPSMPKPAQIHYQRAPKYYAHWMEILRKREYAPVRAYGREPGRRMNMLSIPRLLGAVALLSVFSFPPLKAQAQPAPSGTPTFRVTTRLVFLDVTVLDRKGRPVVKGLTKD